MVLAVKVDVALDPAYITLLSAAGHMPAPNCLAHEREKLLGFAALPKSLWHLRATSPVSYAATHEQPDTVPHKTAEWGLYRMYPYNNKLGAISRGATNGRHTYQRQAAPKPCRDSSRCHGGCECQLDRDGQVVRVC